MRTYIAMLLGINVSGQKMIRMTDLTSLLSELDLKNIRTYIQSGNIVFEYPETDQKELSELIKQKILKRYEFEVPVIIMKQEELLYVAEQNPFVKKGFNIEKLHVTFLEEPPLPEMIEKARTANIGSDEFEIIAKAVYLHCPDGYGQTKLNNNFFESRFKTKATTRNWKTVLKLCEI
jgi:uncharacterized protein (DUF1697 family)